MESKLADFEKRLDELKKKLGVCASEREGQLVKARECEGVFGDLGEWVRVCVGELDGLRVRDPSCVVIEDQQRKCQVCGGCVVCVCVVSVCVCVCVCVW